MVHSVTEQRLYGVKFIDISPISEEYQGGKLLHAHPEGQRAEGPAQTWVEGRPPYGFR